VEFQGKQGIIDQKGGYVIEPEFSLIKFDPPYRWLIGEQGDSTFLFDHDGHVIWRLANSSFIETNGNLMSIRKDRQYRLYELSSLQPLPGPAYAQMRQLGNQFWACKIDSLYWILDDKGQKISAFGYNQVNQYADGYAAFSRTGNWGYLDTLGHEATAPLFGLAWDFREGFARAVFKEGLAYINRKLQLAFYPPTGSIDLRDFSEGLAPVRFTR
ncbi:MAG TPA: WG repeat-containing protein, partial [Saprospiraceae bacterium]|nr:WG repeat-containing protein [Saprospiraceae bacterium]